MHMRMMSLCCKSVAVAGFLTVATSMNDIVGKCASKPGEEIHDSNECRLAQHKGQNNN
jgi:hypothetical protein